MARRLIDSPQEFAVVIAKELDYERDPNAIVRVGMLRDRLRAIAEEARERDRPLDELTVAVTVDADGRYSGTPLIERNPTPPALSMFDHATNAA